MNEAKANLDDEYISHSRSAQDAALDAESEAYTLSKEKYIEQLEEQLKDTETLIENSIMDVLFNADTVYTELNNLADLYGIDLSDSLTQPWKKASAQAIAWKDELARTLSASELELITHESGAVTTFSNGVAKKIEGTWSRVQTAARNYAGYLTSSELSNGFSRTLTGFGSQIQAIVDKWNAVKRAADAAYEAQTRKVTVGGNPNSGDGDGGGGGLDPTPTPPQQYSVRAVLVMGKKMLSAVGRSSISQADAKTQAKVALMGEYERFQKQNGIKERDYEASWLRSWQHKVLYKYAKGTTGVKADQLSIVDELGPELILHADPTTGRLQYLTKGSGVIPSQLTEELMELGKLGVDGLIDANKFSTNMNVISNAVNKPELNIAFDSLIKAENITEETLPAVKKLVTQELDRFTRELNYSLKKYNR